MCRQNVMLATLLTAVAISRAELHGDSVLCIKLAETTYVDGLVAFFNEFSGTRQLDTTAHGALWSTAQKKAEEDRGHLALSHCSHMQASQMWKTDDFVNGLLRDCLFPTDVLAIRQCLDAGAALLSTIWDEILLSPCLHVPPDSFNSLRLVGATQ